MSIEDATLSEGKHGVHIHEVASCDPCGSAKGHFDPVPNSNSSPDGNHPSLFDEDGSSVIVHVDEDTYCPEGEAKSCAGGARAACGLIELTES